MAYNVIYLHSISFNDTTKLEVAKAGVVTSILQWSKYLRLCD